MELTNSKFQWGKYLYGEIFEMWPKDSDGIPEEPVFLCSCSNVNLEDVLKVNMLQSFSIPCLRIDSGDGSFGRVVLGMSGQGTDIYVPRSFLNDAKALNESKEVFFDENV